MKRLTLFFATFLLLTAGSLRADEGDAAKAAFTEGKEAFAAGEYDKAATLFRSAYDAKPTWKLLFNIAQADAAAKRYGLALEVFETYLAEAGDELTEDRLEEVHKEISRLRNMVGVLQVQTHDGAEVFVNGIRRGVAPIHAGISLSGGKTHSVEVHYNGVTLPSQEVRIAGGRTARVEIMGSDVPAEPSDETVATEDGAPESEESGDDAPKGNGLKVGGIVTLSVGLAGIVGGAVTGGVALSKNSLLKEECEDGICDDEFEDDEKLRDTMGLTSTILFGVGAAAVTAGVIMLIVNKKKSNERVTLFPMMGPRVAGAGLNVRF